MHSKKAKVMPSPKPRNDQVLLGDSRRWLFQNLFNLVEVSLFLDSLATNGSIIWKHSFTRGLHRRDGAGLHESHVDQLLSTGLFFSAQVKVIADKMQKGI